MAIAADANKVQEALKELAKQFAKEVAVLKQTVVRLEQRVAALETSQTPKTKQS